LGKMDWSSGMSYPVRNGSAAEATLKAALPILICAWVVCVAKSAFGFEHRGSQFIGFSHFRSFKQSAGSNPREVVLTSPIIKAEIGWNELVASWNLSSPGAYLKVEVRAVGGARATRFYAMGLWCADPARHPRESVRDQRDDDGRVDTDTLKLKESWEGVQVRLTLGGDLEGKRKLKSELRFVSLCLTDTHAGFAPLEPNQAAWGRVIEVPQRSQMAYPNGNALCSPTTVSMLMCYWAGRLHRPELAQDVPEVVKGVFDPNWEGTGNWPFNTAYPGSYPGMRGYVTRLSDLSELEDWIAAGLPVGVSLDYNRLRGKQRPPSGHLVVCVGFTRTGEVVLNDPGTSRNVRKTFARENLIKAWAHSGNTVYLIYPEEAEVPKDRFGHWDSWTAHTRVAAVRAAKNLKEEGS
jgi:hypothetical protein